ncbi:immunoglobulin domain-containing protein, partial [Flavobacterium flevense]|uniref:immunoglobulin domain-containing protein n=2 Tax=Flavobacterium flevense TaxID=983 RepID=UPI00190E79A0
MKTKTTLFLLTFLTFIFSCVEINAQSSGCDITGPTSGNYTFQSNKKVCFNNNATLGDVTFENGSKIYIAPNVTVIIQNNVTSSGTIAMQIDGILQFNQSVTINANVNLNIGTKGVLKAGETGTTNFTLNGSGINTVINDGQFNVGVLGLQNSRGTYTFDSSADAIINIHSNININGKSFFRNQGKLLIGNSYNCNNKSVFVNCGEMISSEGFNLGGGKVINTGTFTVSSSRIDFGSSTARFENYGSVNVRGSMNLGGSGCVYYNEGTTVVSGNFQNDGNIEGPAVGSGKLGYITWKGKAAMNSGKIGPNLNLINSSGTSSKSGMFNSHNEMDFLNGVVYNCSNCPAPQVNSGVICREPDGTTPCNIATPTISTTAASCTQPSSLLISNYDSSVSYTFTPSGPTVVSGGGISGMTIGQSYTLKASKNSCNSSDVLISITKLSGTDTDGDGILDQCEFDETCNVYTTVLAEPTDKLVSDLNRNGKGLFPVEPFGPATLPNGGVNVEVIKGFKSTLTYPSPQWRLYQPNAITGTIVIKGVPTEFKTKYLDLVYASENNLERTVKLDYGVTANSLNTTTHKYRYIVGIAGLSDPNVAGKVTSTVPLEVIGNFDAFKNGKYSYFNDKTPPVAGETGYVFQSNPKTATNVAPPNGYTFFYLPENISSFELETKGNDQYGFIFGTLTTTVAPTPAAPTSGGNQTVCWNGNANHTLTATATAPQGQTVTWYDAETGGNIVTTPNQIGVGNKTYYAQSSNPNQTCPSLTRTAVVLTINPVPTVTIAKTNVTCNGANDGTITAISNGTVVIKDANNQTVGATGLAAGTYTVTASKAGGNEGDVCNAEPITVTITQPTAITLSETHTAVTCNGANDGTITAISNGTVVIKDANNQTVGATGLAAGTYTVTASKAGGNEEDVCNAEPITVTITQPTAITLSETHTAVTCNGANDGTITAISNGTVVIKDANNQTVGATGLAAGTYTVTASKAGGNEGDVCNAEPITVTITQPTAITLSETHTAVTCNGANDGTITTISNGTVVIKDANNQTVGATGLAAGTYTVTASKAGGNEGDVCNAEPITVTITQPTAITLSETHTAVTCNGTNDGTITAISNGTVVIKDANN